MTDEKTTAEKADDVDTDGETKTAGGGSHNGAVDGTKPRKKSRLSITYVDESVRYLGDKTKSDGTPRSYNSIWVGKKKKWKRK